jgi:hypothetical protein
VTGVVAEAGARVPTLAEIAWMLTATGGGGPGAIPASLLDGLARHDGPAVAHLLRQRLAQIAHRLARPELTIVFGGHFSSGKSTLINALIGQDLLPTSDYPETGVACWISAGERAHTRVVTDRGVVSLPFGTEAIAEQVSLIGADGDYRSRVGEIHRLEVFLAGGPLSPGVSWVDSPGINDTEAMTQRAAAAARAADVLVWVVNSRQAMSEVEQAFLGEHVAQRGPVGVVFVVNAFLPTDTAESWEWFMARRADYFRGRITSMAPFAGTSADAGADAAATAATAGAPGVHPAVPAQIEFMSARAGGAQQTGFGIDRVRRLLAELVRDGSPRVRGARLAVAAADLRALVAELDRRATDDRAALALADAAAAERRREATVRRARFDREVRAAVDAVFARHRPAADGCTAQVVASIAYGPLYRDNTYGRALTGKLRAVAARLAADAVTAVAQVAHRHGLGPPDPSAIAWTHGLLQPPELTVVVPRSPAAGPGTVVDGAVGDIVGALISPRAGQTARDWIRRQIGGPSTGPAVDQDRAGARSNAEACGRQVAEAMTGLRAEAGRLLGQGCRDLQPPLPDPDRTRLTVLEQLSHHLAETVLATVDQAAGAAHQEIAR